MADEPADPHILGPGMAPTPFTADEIRDGCPPGRTIRIRLDVDGQPPLQRVNRFVECDEEGAVMEKSLLSPDGDLVGEVTTDRVTWQDLQAHASFPADLTTITPERLETPMGELDCLRYTVRDGDSEDIFWFAKSMPGMPIKYLTRSSGEVESTVTVVNDQR